MEEKKFVKFKKDELEIKEFVKKALGKGRVSNVKIEYTPVGEKIIVTTNRPGFVIGRRGEKIAELTTLLKKKFELENPHIDIQEINKPEFDAQTIADEIALSLEKVGSLRFKVIAYRMLDRIIRAGAFGVEIRLSGKLPSERARPWRFASGYLKKVGNTAKVVDRASAIAKTMAGTVGVKVAIFPPDVEIHDKINVDDDLRAELRKNAQERKGKDGEKSKGRKTDKKKKKQKIENKKEKEK